MRTPSGFPASAIGSLGSHAKAATRGMSRRRCSTGSRTRTAASARSPRRRVMGAGRPFVWEKSYPAGVRWDAPIATSTIPELLDRAVAQFGDRAALEYRDRRISYRELAASADRAAAAFLRLGTNAPVALYLPNTPYHPVSFFGAMRAGKCAVQLSPLDAKRELAHKLSDSGARTVVTTNLFGLAAKALEHAAAGHVDRVIVGDDAAWGAAASATDPIPDHKCVLAFRAIDGGQSAAIRLARSFAERFR